MLLDVVLPSLPFYLFFPYVRFCGWFVTLPPTVLWSLCCLSFYFRVYISIVFFLFEHVCCLLHAVQQSSTVCSVCFGGSRPSCVGCLKVVGLVTTSVYSLFFRSLDLFFDF